MKRTAASIGKASAYLKKMLAEGRYPPGGRLPTIAVLARAVKVSKDAVQSAVGLLVADGTLTSARRGGIHRAHETAPEIPTNAGLLKWQRVERAIASDIAQRKGFSATRPPAIAGLQKQYDASYSTITKALASLTRAELLTRHGPRYHIPRPPAPPSSAKILLISQGNRDTIFQFNLRMAEFISYAQRSCREAGIAFVVCGINEESYDHVFALLPPAAQPFGIILYTHGITPELCDRVLDHLAVSRVPLALVCENLIPEPTTRPVVHRGPLATFTLAEELAGARMGEFWLKRGVRRIGWIAPPDAWQSAWERQRFNGLTRAFQSAGIQGVIIEINAMDPGVQVMPDTDERAQLDQAILLSNKLKKRMFVEQEKMTTIAFEFQELYRAEERYRMLASAIKRVCGTGEVEAVVGANDGVLLHIRHFIRTQTARRFRPPRLAGFDDSQTALENSLTSYNFNIGALADRAVQFLIHPRQDIYGNTEIIRHEGYIVERASSQPNPSGC